MVTFERTFVRQLALILASQATVGLVGLVRIPLAIEVLGVSGYALLASYSAAAAWLIAPATANRQYVVAFGGWPPVRLVERMRGRAGALALTGVIVGLTGFVLGNQENEFVASKGVGTIAATFGILSLGLVLLTPGGARLGRFDAWCGVWLYPILEMIANVTSLAAVYAISQAGDPLVPVFAAAWILPVALPFATGLLLSARVVQRFCGRHQVADGTRAPATAHRDIQPYLWIVISPLVAGGLDLFIVGALLMSEDVAALALLTRLSVPLFILPNVLRMLVVREVGRRHSSAEPTSGLGTMRRTVGVALLLQVAVALAFIVLGPLLADVLSAGEVDPPFLLFPVTALLGVSVLILFVTLSLGSSPGVARGTGRITAVTSFATAALTFVLVPWVGVVGARLSPLATSVLQSLLIGRGVRRASAD